MKLPSIYPDDQIDIPPFFEMELPKLLSLIPSLKAKAFS